MKKSLIVLSLVMSIGLVIAPGCGKKSSTKTSDIEPVTTSGKGTVTTAPNTESPIVPNHKVKAIDLGSADGFAILAYISITSAPISNITGKVGLKPGTRSLINLNPATEVVGGLPEVYAADDIGNSFDYLNIARENLIAAYRDIVSRPADKDKIEIFAGKPGGKILPAGIYRWSNGVTISSDITLEGNDTDIFIFQVTGEMRVSPNVRIILSGGARAKNIFWQVSKRVILESTSVAAGTIISQLTFEMKNLAQLNGRAFVKNGKLLLSQNVITKPE